MLFARTSEEAHLYLSLHPCDCSRADLEPRHWLEQRAEQLVAMPGPSPSFGAGRSQISDESTTSVFAVLGRERNGVVL